MLILTFSKGHARKIQHQNVFGDVFPVARRSADERLNSQLEVLVDHAPNKLARNLKTSLKDAHFFDAKKNPHPTS
ncbi:hypothetical protein [Bradyrhizobium sp. DASA03007]|uniref:hypothetical protein n=1 Tax=unclassified Bradyrhizobium TaxID=2631580 RepID=UPI003F6FFD7E